MEKTAAEEIISLKHQLQSALDRIIEFERYYWEKHQMIERDLDSLSEKLDASKSVPEDLKIKSEIVRHLAIKEELDEAASIFKISLIPIKYVNIKDQGGDNPLQSESEA
jgi:hypothetical protein